MSLTIIQVPQPSQHPHTGLQLILEHKTLQAQPMQLKLHQSMPSNQCKAYPTMSAQSTAALCKSQKIPFATPPVRICADALRAHCCFITCAALSSFLACLAAAARLCLCCRLISAGSSVWLFHKGWDSNRDSIDSSRDTTRRTSLDDNCNSRRQWAQVRLTLVLCPVQAFIPQCCQQSTIHMTTGYVCAPQHITIDTTI